MRKLAGLLVALATIGGGPNLTAAQENEGPTFVFGASTSILWDINDPDDPGFNAATYSSFEQDESFNIDLVQLGVSGSRGRASYGATLDFGDLAAAAGDSADGDVALQTAFLSYDFDGAGVTAGRFGTPIGYEVLEPWGNAHISRSWGWSAQPINHDGIHVHGQAGILEAMIGAVNGFTVADTDGNDIDDEKGVIGSVAAAINDALGLYFAGIFTEEEDTTDTLMLNAIVSGSVPAGGEMSYAIEGNWRQDDPEGAPTTEFWNVTGYLGMAFGAAGFAVRADYTDDEGIVVPVAGTGLWGVTLTGSYALVDGVTVRLEYRHDDADEDVFGDGSSLDDTLDTIQAQVIWTPEL